MKITDVRAVQPVAPGSPPDWRTSLGQILVAIDTDAGLTGYGVGGGGLAGIHVVRSVLRDILLDQDPEPVELHWQRMYRATLPFGQKGLAIMALSGVDLALWDLRGKARKEPVACLLGGKVGQPIPTYITLWDEVPAEMVNQHRAFKLHIHSPNVTEVADRIEKTRRLLGPDIPLMVDAWMSWDLDTTLDLADRIKTLNIAWIEEPLPIDDLAGYDELSRRCPIPIAGGEHEFTAAGFRDWIDHRRHQIVQPDICWCGGMTEVVKIFEMAKQGGVGVCLHRGAEIWGLHAIAALDDNPLAESGRPWMTWVGGQPPIENGYIRLDDRPGFGVDIDEDRLHLLYA
ncbi:MAG: L-rhamnonate dehydratase [Gemmatales bacterium]|nr:MAG: L-rhamnonate dehydratase [Gemmatales bacterium]